MKFFQISKIRNYIFLLSLFCFGNAQSQASFTNLNRDFLLPYESNMNRSEGNFHSNIKPFLTSDLANLPDSFDVPKNKFQRMLYLSGTQSFESNRLDISLAPLLTVLPAYELGETSTLLDSRIGAKLNISWHNKLAFEFQFQNSNANFSSDWNAYTQKKHVLPGNGYAYYSKLGYTNTQWNGYLSYSPNSYFNFAAGRGKNFFGDGYRSLLLSDGSNNYDYLKITTTVWHLRYVNLFTNFKDIRNAEGKPHQFKNKYATFHYLSWNATKRINISFFESIIWQSRDSNNVNLGYDVNYLNPVIFYRSTEYALGSSDNALIGANFKIKLAKNQQVYGQLLIDEFLLKEIQARSGWWANKQGFQLGVKSFDCFKIRNLYFQAEWNYVRPYTYAHSNTNQNYAHFNEPLAHPLGANFSEYLMDVNYQKKLLQLDFKITYANVGLDTASINFGQDIYKSNLTYANAFGNAVGQGLSTDIITSQLTLSYVLNKANNIRIELGANYRQQKNTQSTRSACYFFAGIRTALTNTYFDF